MSRFKVKVGQDFEIDSVKVEIVEPQAVHDPKVLEVEHRNRLSILVLGFIALLVVGAGIIGFYEGNFAKLQAVYNVAVIPMTAILSFYFKPRPSP